jgi:serine protease Do
MSIDRRSFKIGLIAGVFLLSGVLIGLLFGLRMDWVGPVHSQPAAGAPALPVAGAPPSFAPVVKAAMPSVVNISTTRVVKNDMQSQVSPFFNDPFFRHFFGDEFGNRFQIPRDRRENSLGSGVIVDAGGYIVTNNHVVEKADEIKVSLGDRREFTGKVIGSDPKSDIAVIKIDAKDLPVIPWGDSDSLEVGEYVLAMGNPFGLNQTVTLGIVSAVGRANVGIADYEDFIQTDAAINPGNSGGALVNARGELVGINTAIFSRSGGYMGIGFAVPSNMTRKVMRSLIDKGKVVRGWLGVSIQEITPELQKSFALKDTRGALVGEVVKDSPAEKAGFRSGDVIVALDGKAIDSPSALRNTVADLPVGRKVELRVIRDGKTRNLGVTIGEQPKDLAEAGGESAPAETDNTALAGLEVQPLTADIAKQLGVPADLRGVVVSGVNPGSSAGATDLRRGDVITEINREPIRSLADYQRVAGKLGRDDNVLLLVNRRGGKLFIVIKP